MFNEDELEALMLGAQLVQRCGDETLAQAARQLVAKVEAVLPERLLERMGRAALFAAPAPLVEDPARELGTLRKTIHERHKGGDGFAARHPSARPVLLGQRLDGGRLVRAARGLSRLPARPGGAAVGARRDFADEKGRTLSDFLIKVRSEP